MYVIKKDGTHETFNPDKIIAAVNKSAARILYQFSEEEKKFLCDFAREKAESLGKEGITIQEMHNIVEGALDKVNPAVAKSYRDYRNYKQDFVHMMDDVYTKSQSIRYIGDKENSNTDSALVATKRSLIYNELSKRLYRKFFMTRDELQACKDGYIYIHDQSARLDTMNCFSRDTRFITNRGVKSFYDFCDGDEVLVVSHKGVWRKATVHSHGWQKIQRVTLKRGSGKEKQVLVTPDHRWILKDGSVTTNLKVGDRLVSTPDITGFDFGDVSGENDREDKTWFVTKIEPAELSPTSQVWCLDVEVDHSFLLENGIPTGNCCLCDIASVMSGGFEMGNVWYNEPKTLDTAFDVLGDIILATASQQYGGFTVPEIDKILSPYAEKSYEKYCNEWVDITGDIGEGSDGEKQRRWAMRKVERDFEQGFQGIEMKLNTVGSSRGDYPFITMTFGLATDVFGKMASITFLRVHMNGQGKPGNKKPVLFPKLVFLYDKNLHGKGCVNEDVFEAGIQCSSKTMYPDWLSLTGEGYVPEMYKKYGRVVSPMGCVDGNSRITYKFQKNHRENFTFKQMWEEISAFIKPAGQSGEFDKNLVIDLTKQNVFIYDTGKGFTKVKYLIRNESKWWCTLRFDNGKSLVCTVDHPFTCDRGEVQAKDLRSTDAIPYTTRDYRIEYCHVLDIQFEDREDYSYDVTTETEHFEVNSIRSHNCRAFLSPWFERGGMTPADDEDKPVFVGRFNIGAVSLNLPMILAKARQENRDFYEALDYYLEMIRGIHKRTYEYLGELRASANPIGFCEGGFYGGHLKPRDKIKPLLKPMTASFGITALNELQELYNGKSIAQDGQFALEVLKYINDRVTEFKQADGWLYALYGTPAESLCFSGDTLVQTYSGDKMIKDITTDDLVYSFNEKEHKVELKRVLASQMTGRSAETVKVTFDTGQEIICTPNHKFAVRKITQSKVDGKIVRPEHIEYVEAAKLKPGDRIKSNYVRFNPHTGRYECSVYYDGRRQSVHEINAEYAYGKKPEGYVVHHKDGNKENNTFENLEYMSGHDHRVLHMDITIGKNCHTSENQSGENNSFYGKHHTKESLQKNREAHLGKPIVRTDMEGKIINSYRCVQDAKEEGFTEHLIRLACRGARKVSDKIPHPHFYKDSLWFYCETAPELNHKVISVTPCERTDVYDIEVEDNHNFFVGGKDGILVHNCGLQVEQFRKKYGIVANVSDRPYVSNSFHCHVTEDITPIEKQDLEGRFWNLCNGGKIQYVRYPIDYNIEAIRSLINRAMELGYYEGVNLSLAYCDDCGYQELEMDVCPVCGSRNLTKIDRMNGYLSYSRVHGDTRLNEAKMAEIAERKSM